MLLAYREDAALDFGIARLVEQDGSSPGETHAGEMLGTPLSGDSDGDLTSRVIAAPWAVGRLPMAARQLV